MVKEIKSKYASVNIYNSVIKLYDKEPSDDIMLKNVIIKINSDATIEVFGDRIEWACTNLTDEFLEDMVLIPHDRYIKYGYKNIIDIFKGIKKPYVYGWYKLAETKPYHSIMNKWYIEYE